MRQILLTMIGLSVALMADFSRDGDGVITDSITRLQWQDDYSDNGGSYGGHIKTTKWTDAIDYCEALSLGGHDDWRLPNYNELYYIADRSKRYPAIDTIFRMAIPNYYWSSSSVVGYEKNAWYVNFHFGIDNWHDKSTSHYVRCVRVGQ